VPQAHPKQELQSDHSASSFHVLGPVFFYFLTAGVATVMLGPLLPWLTQRWQIQDAQAGGLFTASFLGQLIGAWFATRNLRNSILYGAAISAVGCVVMPWVSFSTAPLAIFCIGLGLGAGLAAGNVIVGTAVQASRARLLALLNIAWSLGAISCPVLVQLSAPHGVRLFFLLTAVGLAVSAFFAIALPHTLQQVVKTADSPQPSPRVAAATRSLPLISLLAFASALFLYIGIENSLGGWLPSYAIRTNPSLRASSVAFFFWIAELSGRLLTAVLDSRIGETALYRISLALLIFAEILLCITARLTSAEMVVLAILCGLALAPLYPLIVSFMITRIGNHSRLGALFACASLGGAALPWLTGIISTQFHGLRAGLIVPTVGACLLILLSTALTRKPSAHEEI
jgi:FHS family glucose/mannose:H+ symporter-like MFS transporter